MVHLPAALVAGSPFQESTTPTPEPGTGVFDDISRLVDACGEEPDGVCEWVFNRTDNETLASIANWAVDLPLRVIFILVGAFIVKRLVQRAIRTFAAHLVEQAESERLADLRRNTAGRVLLPGATDARTKARTETVSVVLSSITSLAVWTIAGLLILGELGISLAPLLAGAGIAGVALGFGAQTIVRDFLAGFFMLVEDQFGVGDVVDVGPVTATVERVSLRATVLRDVNGNVWHVPNGEITRVGNFSQLWSRAVLDIEVAYDTDLRLAQGIIQRVAEEVWHDPEFTEGEILEAPEVWGVETLGADGIAIRLVVKTAPAQQWVVARELRLRIKEAFDEAGVEIPYPQRTVWINSDERPERPDPTGIEVRPPRRASQRGEPSADPSLAQTATPEAAEER
jgi:moderate conductance mechanosensitive channel